MQICIKFNDSKFFFRSVSKNNGNAVKYYFYKHSQNAKCRIQKQSLTIVF